VLSGENENPNDRLGTLIVVLSRVLTSTMTTVPGLLSVASNRESGDHARRSAHVPRIAERPPAELINRTPSDPGTLPPRNATRRPSGESSGLLPIASLRGFPPAGDAT
jgi:hypothetical protein